jgi:hypothetical protein
MMVVPVQGKMLFLAALIVAASAGTCFVVGGICDMSRCENPRKGAAYVVAGLAALAVTAVIASRELGRGDVAPDQMPGPADPAAGLIGPLLEEAVAITKAALVAQ